MRRAARRGILEIVDRRIGANPATATQLPDEGPTEMRGFGYLAERTIRTSDDGRRMLALHGPFARPYDVSGPDTEERVIRRLTAAYRAAMVPVLGLLVFLLLRPGVHELFGGLAATALVGWLIVRIFLHRDLRRLRRIERPAPVGLVEPLGPSARVLIRRRRRMFLAGFLGSCLYSAVGVAMVFSLPAPGSFAATFFGFCAVRWWTMFRLPPEALLQMRSTPFEIFCFEVEFPEEFDQPTKLAPCAARADAGPLRRVGPGPRCPGGTRAPPARLR